MYCVECGSTLPNEAQYCPRCGKQSVLDEVTSDTAVPEAAANAEISTANTGKVLEPEQSLQFETYPDLSASKANASSKTVAQTVSVQSAAGNSKVANRYVNVGSITLGVFGLICLILGAVQGFIPIFLIEGVVFGALAWLCAARWPLSPSAFSAVFITSLLLAGLVGVTLDQDTFAKPRFRFFSEGATEFRTDERAGITDRLGSSGWFPISFDKDSEQLPAERVAKVTLSDGHWYSSPEKLSFEATNNSGYVLKEIDVWVEIRGKDGKKASDSLDLIKLTGDGLEYGDTGRTWSVYGRPPRALAEGETWSYTVTNVNGWKR